MNGHERRSLSSSMRALLLAATGTMGLMALGASTAAATEAPAGPGLLGSVTATVGPTGVPAALSPLTDPLQHVAAVPASDATSILQTVPVLPDLVMNVPDVASTPAGTVLEPVTTLVDGVVAEVPIVRAVVPAGAVTGVTAPVTSVVDNAVGGVTAPVLEVAAPVVRIIDPVVDVVVPLPDLGLPDPVVEVPVVPAPVVEVPEVPEVPVVPAPAPAPVLPSSAEDILPDADRVAVEPRTIPSDDDIIAPASEASAVVDGVPARTAGMAGATSGEASPTGFAAAGISLDASTAALVPTVSAAASAHAAPAVSETPALPGVPSLSGSVPSSMTGGGAAAPLAALTGSAFVALPVLGGITRGSTSSGLPAGPSYEPGSSPD